MVGESLTLDERLTFYRGASRGPLDRECHGVLALWAVDCAERVWPLFARGSEDDAPRLALEVGRAWAAGAGLGGRDGSSEGFGYPTGMSGGGCLDSR